MNGANVQQSGVVTRNHLASWTADGIIQDSGMALSNTFAEFASTLQGINFNSTNTDYPIPINLPANYTRYRIVQAIISGASANLSSATCGLFTAASAGGVAVVTSGTAVTVTQTLADTNNNMQALTINDQNTMSLSDGTLYFRVQTAAGLSAVATVTIIYQPLP